MKKTVTFEQLRSLAERVKIYYDKADSDISDLKADVEELRTAVDELPTITYGTDDLTPRSSALNTGDVYLMYE